jgi:low affinity Fe/Cu permease
VKRMPSQGKRGRSVFDRFADLVSRVTARAWFFAACVTLVVLWAPSIMVIDAVDTWQLIINTVTTIITFLLVGLMQNISARSDAASQQKLNALAQGQLRLLVALGFEDSREAAELREAVGLEQEEGAG